MLFGYAVMLLRRANSREIDATTDKLQAVGPAPGYRDGGPTVPVWIRRRCRRIELGTGTDHVQSVNGCLLVAGGLLTVTALVLMAFTGWFVFAMLSLLVGAPALVGGIVLIIESKRRKPDRG